jgi:hypothetical protein
MDKQLPIYSFQRYLVALPREWLLSEKLLDLAVSLEHIAKEDIVSF